MRGHRVIRSKKGSTLGLVALCSLLAVIALGAAFQLMIYLGSSQELKNSVDAAALNVGMRATEIKVPAPVEFEDVADCNGRIGLQNINRVWGKALLVNANAEDMRKSSLDNQFVKDQATRAYMKAGKINDQLYNMLTSGASTDAFFNQMTANKPAKLLKVNGAVNSNHDDEWSTACLYPGEESNISFDAQSLPTGTVLHSVEVKDKTFIQGYNPMTVNQKDFCFTTFHNDEAPHLVGMNLFNKAKQGAIEASFTPIPNTFKTGGALNGKLNLNASAAAVANPMLTYQLHFPRAYVMIKISNSASANVAGENKSFYYGPGTDRKTIVTNKKVPIGSETAYGTLGKEYTSSDVYGAITALKGDKTEVMARLLQRCREMRPGYTNNQLINLLRKIPYPAQATRLTVCIYDDDKCDIATGELPELSHCVSYLDENSNLVVVNTFPSFIPTMGAEGSAEGRTKTMPGETAARNQYNKAFSTVIGQYPTDDHWTEESGTVTWTPGTGMQKNLGVLSISRETTLTYTGMPPKDSQ